MDDYLQIVLKKMCDVIDLDYTKVDFKEDSWFSKHTWNDAQQTEFKKWMIEYLYNDTKARKAMLEVPIRTKQHITKAVNEFIFNYGWKNNY